MDEENNNKKVVLELSLLWCKVLLDELEFLMRIVGKDSTNVYSLYKYIFKQMYGQDIIIERYEPKERKVEHGELVEPQKFIPERKKFLGIF
jgi:hypothetical protein